MLYCKYRVTHKWRDCKDDLKSLEYLMFEYNLLSSILSFHDFLNDLAKKKSSLKVVEKETDSRKFVQSSLNYNQNERETNYLVEKSF